MRASYVTHYSEQLSEVDLTFDLEPGVPTLK
jgi:hypothetical protein